MNRPTFSIVIPTYARPDRLAACIASIAALDYPRELFEVIVVDDGWSEGDRNVEALAPYQAQLTLRLERKEHAGPAAARNRGAALAKNEYIAFTDDDCRVDPGWLDGWARCFARQPRAVAGGKTINALVENLYTDASETLVAYIRHYHHLVGTPFFASNNLALARETFAALGGFDERFPLAAGEDRDFCDRCVTGALPFADVDDAVVTHYHALSPRRYWRQHFNYGRGAYFFRLLRAGREAPAQPQPVKVEPLRFYWDLVTWPLAHGTAGRRWRLVALMFVSQVANSSGFFVEKWRQGKTA